MNSNKNIQSSISIQVLPKSSINAASSIAGPEGSVASNKMTIFVHLLNLSLW